jgi:hypothetical protein
MRLSPGAATFRSAMLRCHSVAQRNASTTLENSTSNPSPVVLTIRPRRVYFGPSPCCRRPGEWGIEDRDGPHGQRGTGASAKPGSARSTSPGGRDWLLRSQAWARFGAGLHKASISATRLSRSRQSIFGKRRSSSGPALGRRVSSPQVGPNDFMRPRWSRQRRPSAPFSRAHPISSPCTLSTRWLSDLDNLSSFETTIKSRSGVCQR